MVQQPNLRYVNSLSRDRSLSIGRIRKAESKSKLGTTDYMGETVIFCVLCRSLARLELFLKSLQFESKTKEKLLYDLLQTDRAVEYERLGLWFVWVYLRLREQWILNNVFRAVDHSEKLRFCFACQRVYEGCGQNLVSISFQKRPRHVLDTFRTVVSNLFVAAAFLPR